MANPENTTDPLTRAEVQNGTQTPSITLLQAFLMAIAQQGDLDETSKLFKKQLESWIGEYQAKNKQNQVLEALNQKVNQMIDRVHIALKSKRLKPKVQHELGLLLNQLLDIQDLVDPMLVDMADIAISILVDDDSTDYPVLSEQSEKPGVGRFLRKTWHQFWDSLEQPESKNLILARRIRQQIQREITIGKDQATTLVKGLSCFLLIGVGIPLLVLFMLSYGRPTRITLSETRSRDHVHIKLIPDRTISVIPFGGKSLIVGPEEE